MRLWTIKDINGYNELKETKILRGKTEYVDDEFRMAYNWMMEQMKNKLKFSLTNSSTYPVWAWYQWGGANKKKPDLRCSGYEKKGKKLFRIETEIEKDKVLLSDFDLFHYVLNYWYLPKDEEDQNIFDKEMKKNNITLFDLQNFNENSKLLDELRFKVEKSWNQIFDLDIYNEYVNTTEREKSIQATFLELRWEQVINVKEFIAR